MPRTTQPNRTNSIAFALPLVLLAGSAHAAVTWLGGAPSIPDYYQHQLANQGRAVSPDPLPVPTGAVPGAPNYDQTTFWWEGYHDMGTRVGGGWCATTAWTNAMKYWDDHGYRGLIDRSAQGGAHAGKSWLEQFTYSNGALALTQDATDGGCAWVDSVRSYVRASTITTTAPAGVDPLINRYMWKGGGVQKMTSAEGTEYRTNNVTTGNAEPLFSTMWDILTTSVAQGYTAVIKIGESPNAGPSGDPNNGHWWGNFHVLTLAGYEGWVGNNATVYLADPNDTLRNGVTAAGWGVPYAANAALPMAAANYGSFTIGNDGRTITSGAYNGSTIDQVYLMKVPSPGALSLASLALFLTSRRRR